MLPALTAFIYGVRLTLFSALVKLRQRESIVSAGDIVARLTKLDTEFFPQHYTPHLKKVSASCVQLSQVVIQTYEAEQDIIAAHERGEDLRPRVADIQLTFRRLAKCYDLVAEENAKLARSARLYADKLDTLTK